MGITEPIDRNNDATSSALAQNGSTPLPATSGAVFAAGADTRVKRRQIEGADLPAVADLLVAGFPERTRERWLRGLDRMANRRVPEGRPRFGLMLEARGRPVGVLLMIFSEQTFGGRPTVRCNLSSWYTEAAFSPHASLLLNAALKSRDVTFVNISPAPRTQPIIEAQGFRSFCHGSLLAFPTLAWPRRRLPVTWLGEAEADGFAEGELIRDHLALGCLCLAVTMDGERQPFVFARPTMLRGVLPCAQLLYCRSIEAISSCAGALGGALLRRGIGGLLVDTEERLAGMPTRRINTHQPRYARGPLPPRPGDLAYTELAIFNG